MFYWNKLQIYHTDKVQIEIKQIRVTSLSLAFQVRELPFFFIIGAFVEFRDSQTKAYTLRYKVLYASRKLSMIQPILGLALFKVFQEVMHYFLPLPKEHRRQSPRTLLICSVFL